MKTVLHDVFDLGQSAWLDYISRDLIASGGLAEWIEKGVVGVTTNPSIFENAIAKTSDYDKEIADLAAKGQSASDIYETLTLQEVGAAADIMRPVYDKTKGVDGYVSLEVNPLLASDKETTISEAKRLFVILNRPNVMIKIPATPEGIEALSECIAAGVNVNSTLIFSEEQYAGVAKAYIKGLKARAAKGESLSVASVASVFVSRVDTAVDKALSEKGESAFCGKIAVDSIRLTYQRFKSIFSGSDWDGLKAKGARVQRPLWASTGTKNPAYSDIKYVQELIGPDTVNTIPPKTLDAFVNHGKATSALEDGLDAAKADMKHLSELGINLSAVCDKLLADGLESFNGAFRSLISSIEKKAK